MAAKMLREMHAYQEKRLDACLINDEGQNLPL